MISVLEHSFDLMELTGNECAKSYYLDSDKGCSHLHSGVDGAYVLRGNCDDYQTEKVQLEELSESDLGSDGFEDSFHELLFESAIINIINKFK